ncbi:aminotransferase class V-fold PLP-dependent enzyme [Sporolactobacillus shoreicorticis]|nr:aminotransferase class V-fold PLP-dependent enzyme [Sporolactobacillus shoreicorticis]
MSGDLLYGKNIALNCDAVQSLGKLIIDAEAKHINTFSASTNKIFGPKGVDICSVNPHIAPPLQLSDVPTKYGICPGLVHLPAIAAFAMAAQGSRSMGKEEPQPCISIREQFIAGIRNKDISFIIEGSAQHQLPHIFAIRISGIEGQQIMLAANRRGLIIATGSACSAPAFGLLLSLAGQRRSTALVRLSFGETTTEE